MTELRFADCSHWILASDPPCGTDVGFKKLVDAGMQLPKPVYLCRQCLDLLDIKPARKPKPSDPE